MMKALEEHPQFCKSLVLTIPLALPGVVRLAGHIGLVHPRWTLSGWTGLLPDGTACLQSRKILVSGSWWRPQYVSYTHNGVYHTTLPSLPETFGRLGAASPQVLAQFFKLDTLADRLVWTIPLAGMSGLMIGASWLSWQEDERRLGGGF